MPMMRADYGISTVESLWRRPIHQALTPSGPFGGSRDVRNYTPEDVRFTCKGDTIITSRDGRTTNRS